MMQEDLVSAGSWLFKWRGYIPLAAMVILLPAMLQFTYPLKSHALDQVMDFCCFAISLFGFALRVLTVGFVPRDTSGRNTKGQVALQLNTSGMYSLMRHPLYFANFWMWMGVALFPRVWWVPVLMGVFFIFLYERIICAEEAFLAERFGDAYRQWASRTPIGWPRFRNWIAPDLPFSWRSVLRRENSTFLALAAIFFFLETVGTLVFEQQFTLDLAWSAVLIFAVVLYVSLKILKRRKFLNEPGR